MRVGAAVMPSAIAGIVNTLGGPFGVIGGLITGTDTGLIGQLLGLGNDGTDKPETTVYSIKTERPPRVRAYGISRLYGASICYETVNGTTVDVYAFHDGRAAAILRVYLNDDQVTVTGGIVQQLDDKSYQGNHVRVGYSLGQTPGTAFSAVTSVLPAWDASHRGDGVVCGYLIKTAEDSKHFLETYPQGDNVSLSLVGQWTPVFDLRDSTQDPDNEATWKHSENAVLAFVHYLMVERGYTWERRFAPQLTKLITAINIADQDMTLAAGGTEKRYRTALSYKATETPANVQSSLLACFDGWYSLNEAGEVIVYAGEYYTPAVSIGPDQITSYQHQIGVEDENVVNSIAVPYVSDLHDYSSVDAQPWTDEDDITRRGKENSGELGAIVPSFTQGRRLAKVKMARNNAPDRGTITTTYAGSAVIGERYINLLVEEAGAVFFDGVAEISAITRNEETGGVTFDWVKADPNAYDWNPATEDGYGASVEDRVAVVPLPAATISSALAEFVASTDAGTGARIRIKSTATGDGYTWYARWRVGSTGAWNEDPYDDLDPSAAVEILTGLVPIAATIQVEIEYQATDGRLSGWSAPVAVDTRTDVTAPDAAASIALASWDTALNLTTPRIARASSYRWRFYSDVGATTLARQIVTSGPSVAYAKDQAAADGAKRLYVARVAGVNAAGIGTQVTSSAFTLPAPAAPTTYTATGGATTATVTCSNVAGAAGYVVFYSDTAGFDPATTGGIVASGTKPVTLYGLDAGTYYARIAAYDQWSANPAGLNLSPEMSFTITTGGGSTPSGGGTGGGGYHGGGGTGGGAIP